MLTTIAHSAAFKGALAGLVSAAAVDYHAFLSWKSVNDAKKYAWSTALLRWGQGAVSGAIMGGGYGALVS
jgi:hypothetical protein